MNGAVQVFPVSLVPGEATPIRSARGHRCPTRVTYSDWHMQLRAGGAVHHAQDIFAPETALVLAPVDGVVVGSSSNTGATAKGGHHVSIRVVTPDGRAVRTYYMAHLRDVPLVRVGDRVLAGHHVGYVGRTGNATRTCPHLHIGARRYWRGSAINIYSELLAVDPTEATRRARVASKKKKGGGK